MSKVILVDESDREIGEMDKLEAHVNGLLHRAFSVFLFNPEGKLLMQRRAFGKYHSGGLWTNTCCSHPAPGESIEEAAHRRLDEEMGLTCDLKKVFSFIYKAKLDHDLTEYELDHVLIGLSDDTPHLDPEEAIAFKWMSFEDLKKDVRDNPDNYTVWFRLLINEHFDEIYPKIAHESL